MNPRWVGVVYLSAMLSCAFAWGWLASQSYSGLSLAARWCLR